MEIKKQIEILSSLGYGKKTIARELGVSKNTVKSYLEGSDEKDTDCTNETQSSTFHVGVGNLEFKLNSAIDNETFKWSVNISEYRLLN